MFIFQQNSKRLLVVLNHQRFVQVSQLSDVGCSQATDPHMLRDQNRICFCHKSPQTAPLPKEAQIPGKDAMTIKGRIESGGAEERSEGQRDRSIQPSAGDADAEAIDRRRDHSQH